MMRGAVGMLRTVDQIRTKLLAFIGKRNPIYGDLHFNCTQVQYYI